MSQGYLAKMLDMLTGAYARTDVANAKRSRPLETNIGRLFALDAWVMEIIHENAERILLWDNLDKAKGQVLDRYGLNFGVKREGAPDDFYRLLIQVKLISLLSGGDINTIVHASASLFNIPAEEVVLQELFPAKIWVLANKARLDEEHIRLAPLIAQVTKRIAAAGVGMRIFFREVSVHPARVYLGTAGYQTTRTSVRPQGQLVQKQEPEILHTGTAVWENRIYQIRPRKGRI